MPHTTAISQQPAESVSQPASHPASQRGGRRNQPANSNNRRNQPASQPVRRPEESASDAPNHLSESAAGGISHVPIRRPAESAKTTGRRTAESARNLSGGRRKTAAPPRCPTSICMSVWLMFVLLSKNFHVVKPWANHIKIASIRFIRMFRGNSTKPSQTISYSLLLRCRKRFE